MKKFLLALALSLLSISTAHAYPSDWNSQFRLNTSSPNAPQEALLGDQIFVNAIRSQRCTWSFSRQGGAIGAINLQSTDGESCKIPKGALIVNALVSVTSAVTAGSTATIAVSSGVGAGDILATYWNNSPVFSSLAAGLRVQGIPIWGTVGSIVKTTASGNTTPTLTIGTHALSGGAIDVFIQYILSN